ncbi:odorant receptor 10-like [Euwallacea similis]|uniref:odorant receptor 10-like n=1 Tax=Euwallacea similis TaxID=1736056 RepID=UPI00344EFB22
MHDLWYPFRRETHMRWVILLNMIMVSQGTCLNTATQSTFISLMIYASSRFKILKIKLRKFDEIAHEENSGDIMTTVKILTKEHQNLLHFVESLNERTKYVMLMEFLLNSISLASVTIQLVVVTTLSRLFTAFSIVVLQLFQIFILAWSANEISQEGLLVADAIGSSKWYEQNAAIRKLFLMMIMRAQIPIGLTAGPFFRMSTNTALTTVKAAYTYLSLMMQNYEK